MVISRSGPASSRRYDYMATAAKPPPPHASSSPSTHPSSTASTTSTMKRQSQKQQQQQHQHQRGIVQNHHHHHQSSLHDFSFPVLAWGRQRLLRCAKVPPHRNEGASFGGGCAGSNVSRAGGVVTDRRFAAPPPVPPRTKVAQVKDDGLEKIRAKLMGQLREAAGRMELEGRAIPASAARRSDAPPTWEEEDEEEEDEEEEDDGDDEEDDEEYPDALDRTPVPAPSLAAAVAPQPLVPAGPLEEVKPWKMRTRRSTYKHARTSEPRRRRLDSSPSPAVSSPHRAPPSSAAGGAAANPADPLPVPVAPPPPRSLRSRSSAPPTPEDQDPAADEDQHQRAVQPRRSRQQPSRQPQQQQRRKPFSVTLSKEEIEEDIYALTGRRASRRPKKRPRALRRQLDMLVPGYYLSEVTLSQYDVREPARES